MYLRANFSLQFDSLFDSRFCRQNYDVIGAGFHRSRYIYCGLLYYEHVLCKFVLFVRSFSFI